MRQSGSLSRAPRLSRRATLTALLAGAAVALLPPTPARAAPDIGQAWLSLTLVRRSGDRLALADMPGQLLIVAFWDASCAVCRAEVPALGRAVQATAPGGVALLLVSYPSSWDQDYAAATELGLAAHCCTVADESDPDLLDAAINVRNGVFKVPQSFVFTRSTQGGDLRLKLAQSGRMSWRDQIL